MQVVICEDGEDDELPCVIGERAGDCVWRGSRRSVRSSFRRRGAAYLKERFVIFKEDRVGGRARVNKDEERVLWQGWTEIKSWRYWGWRVVVSSYSGYRFRTLVAIKSTGSVNSSIRTALKVNTFSSDRLNIRCCNQRSVIAKNVKRRSLVIVRNFIDSRVWQWRRFQQLLFTVAQELMQGL